MAKWESYKKGLIKRQVMQEIKSVGDKEWRKKAGIEEPPLLEFKKNTHYLMYAMIEVAELLMSRIDGIMKGTYIALDNQVNGGFKRVETRMDRDMKALAANVQRSNAEMSSEMTKKLKQSSMRENKILSEVKDVRGEVDGLLDTMRDDILKASKGIIKATAREITNLRGNIEVETDEVGDRIEKVEENILSFLNTMDSEMSVTIKDRMGDIARAIQVFNNELNKRAQSRAKDEEEKFKQLDGKLEDLTLKTHVATRNMSDNMTKGLGQIKTGISKEMNDFTNDSKAMLVHNEDVLTEESKKTSDQLKDLTDIVQENYMDTQKMLKDQHRQLMDTVTKNQEETRRIMEREISEVRNLIANIRGDIELIKTFLTKLHA